MPKRTIKSGGGKPVALGKEERLERRKGRPLPADAAALMAELAAEGRARRQCAEAGGTLPWEAVKDDPAWQQRWDELLTQIRGELPDGITPEEIEAEIRRVTNELRDERLMGHR